MQQLKVRVRNYLLSPEKVVLSLALIFSLLSAVLVPQLSVNDEGSHFLKAYSLSTGKLAGRECIFPKSIVDKATSMSRVPHPEHLVELNVNQTPEKVTCGSAGSYTPIMHIPQAIGIGIGRAFSASPDTLVLLARIANAIFYSVALFFIVRFAKIGKWAFVVIGLFPFMIHTAGSVSADTMNSIVVLASLAFIFNLFIQKEKLSYKQIVTIVVIALLLTLTKPTNTVLLLPLVVLPAQLFKPNKKKLPFNVQKWLLLILCGLTVLLFAYLSQKLLGSSLFIGEPVNNPLKSDPLRFFYILYNTYINPVLGYGDMLLRGVVGEFSSFQYHVPTIVLFVEFGLLALTLIYKDDVDTRVGKKELNALALTSIISLLLLVLAVTVALYSAWAIQPHRLGPGAIYADGVQGRYFTAALATLIPVGLFLTRFIRIELRPRFILGPVVFTVSLATLCFYIVETFLVYS